MMGRIDKLLFVAVILIGRVRVEILDSVSSLYVSTWTDVRGNYVLIPAHYSRFQRLLDKHGMWKMNRLMEISFYQAKKWYTIYYFVHPRTTVKLQNV